MKEWFRDYLKLIHRLVDIIVQVIHLENYLSCRYMEVGGNG